MKIVVRWLGAALLAASLVACHAPDAGRASAGTMQLKLYQVPADQSKAIADHLGAVLEDAKFQMGMKDHTSIRVTQPFPGTVMVLAPASVQPSIGQALDKLDQLARNKPDQPHQNGPSTVPVRVQFWLVQAKSGSGKDAPALAALAPSLKQVRKLVGPSHFVVEEAVSTVTRACTPLGCLSSGGQMSTIRGHQYKFDPQFTAAGNVLLNVAFADRHNRTIQHLQTAITTKPGQYVVLASAPGNKQGDDGTLMNLLVVRVTRLAAAAH